ncbi:hypothetical protein DUNSADRAFT_3562 [Dunaliella salina]|uniref:ubiquitinyl hydrolase 1 n=1 Tax=Dunaliella salina TaxID=3046 RepID=A0ABQ7H7Z2_DUNSA|nr:hypothetical protein DUNSADRAFT_3562 [Dunaliella salina]|eukprot:KAF5842969.1 hypothetical protein DUNSADRAFT_3562 [Dunaliella salina]
MHTLQHVQQERLAQVEAARTACDWWHETHVGACCRRLWCERRRRCGQLVRVDPPRLQLLWRAFGAGGSGVVGDWSEVTPKKGRKGANAQRQAASAANNSSGAAAGAGPGGAPAGVSGAMAAALNARPLVPSSLSDVVRRFSPQYAAAEAAQANGKMTMAEKISLKRGTSVQQQEQQDAQEFLHYLLDTAHEELLLLRKNYVQAEGLETQPAAAADNTGDQEEWAQVTGKRNKAAVTRQAGVPGGVGAAATTRSPVNIIFSGATKSVVKAGSAKPSATVEAFTMMHLEIHDASVTSVESALAHHLAPVTLTDFKPEGSNVAGLATKNMYLYSLPEVLVLHLKRFQYTGSIVKNHKVRVPFFR